MARSSNRSGPAPRGGTRVVHIATRFFASGSERSVAEAIRALPSPEFEHVLVVGRDHDATSIRNLCGEIEVVVATNLIRQPHPIRDLRALIELARIFRRLRPDVLHTIQSKAGILGRLAGRATHVSRFVHTVNMANFGPGFNPVMSRVYIGLERLAARWTSEFAVNGLELTDRYVRAGIASADQFTLVRSAVDTSAFVAAAAAGTNVARAAIGLQLDRPTILFAGSLDRRKGALDLPVYLESLRRHLPNAHLLVAGEGPLRDRVKQTMSALELDEAVSFIGFTPRLPEAVAAADCLIMLSRAEGLATVLLHAAAAGTPFVSYAVDGPGELIDMGARGAVAPLGNLQRAVDLTVEMVGLGRGPQLDLADWTPETVRRAYAGVFRASSAREHAA